MLLPRQSANVHQMLHTAKLPWLNRIERQSPLFGGPRGVVPEVYQPYLPHWEGLREAFFPGPSCLVVSDVALEDKYR
jgi:hypothetical protein